MGIGAHRSLDKRATTTPLGACIDQEHLMDIVARAPIGGGDQDACKGCHGAAISQSIETRPLERGAAVAVVAGEGLVGDMPIGVGGDRVTETAELLINGRGLLLTGR
jgi:hypothetical protein